MVNVPTCIRFLWLQDRWPQTQQLKRTCGSEFHRSWAQALCGWALVSGEAEITMSAALDSCLGGARVICFPVHSCPWWTAFLCDCRSEVPISLLALIQRPLSPSQGYLHPHSLSHSLWHLQSENASKIFLHLWLYFCFVNKLVCTIFFLDSTYKQYHMIFVFVWLISLIMTISRSIHVAAKDIIDFFFMNFPFLHQ